jgi:hypothetical protein
MQSGLNNPSTPGVDTAWASWQKDRLEWTVQKNIPAGEYLVRVEHLGLHEGHVGKTQCEFSISTPLPLDHSLTIPQSTSSASSSRSRAPAPAS